MKATGIVRRIDDLGSTSLLKLSLRLTILVAFSYINLPV